MDTPGAGERLFSLVNELLDCSRLWELLANLVLGGTESSSGKGLAGTDLGKVLATPGDQACHRIHPQLLFQTLFVRVDSGCLDAHLLADVSCAFARD